MTDRERMLSEIERDERWLADFDAAEPDTEALNRVKIAVRRAVSTDSDASNAQERAIASTKAAVRRELSRMPARTRVAWHHWGAFTAAAAAVTIAVIGVGHIVSTEPSAPTELEVFVQTLERGPDAFQQELLDMGLDVDELEAGWLTSGGLESEYDPVESFFSDLDEMLLETEL